MKKKQQFTFDDLEQDAKDYVEMRVRRLGSVEAVKGVYKRDDLVSRYAWHFAERLYGGGPKLSRIEL